MSGTIAQPIGITNPPIDELLSKTDNKYALVIYAAQRARQINAYYAQLQEGLLDYVGPLVETEVSEKPLSVSLREINEGLVTAEAPAADAAALDGSGVDAAALDAAALDASLGGDSDGAAADTADDTAAQA